MYSNRNSRGKPVDPDTFIEMQNQWEALHRKAKSLESRLETKVQRYSSLAQQINADFLCDEENPLIESAEERDLAGDIERDLNDLAECIDNMRSVNSIATPSHHQEVLIKRYHEIHFDFTTEFKNTASTVHRKRESMELFNSSKNLHRDEHDSSTAKLLRERSSVQASLRSVQDVLMQANEAKNALLGQRSSLNSAAGGLGSLVANVPSLNRLLEGIQKKKSKDKAIIAVVIGLLICFSLWWILR